MTTEAFKNIKFFNNSFIGYDQKEISITSDEDLMTIKNIIHAYLKSNKQKKPNGNFKDVYFRILKELKKRKTEKIKTVLQKIDYKYTIEKLNDTSSTIVQSNLSQCSYDNKLYQIPEFLNDKISNPNWHNLCTILTTSEKSTKSNEEVQKCQCKVHSNSNQEEFNDFLYMDMSVRCDPELKEIIGRNENWYDSLSFDVPFCVCKEKN